MIIGHFIVKLFFRSLFLTLISPNDIMFFKVLSVTLITMCAADNRLLHTELDSEQQLPVLRFNGHVLFPRIFKYAKVDQYNTFKSKSRPVRSALPNRFRKLQYAPLREGASLINKNAGAEYMWKVTPTPSNDYSETTADAKSYLEPRPEATDTKCYAPRYKVEAVAAVSRSPGHNAVYRLVPEPIEPENTNKVGYVKPIGINVKLEPLHATTTKPPLDLASEHVLGPLTNDHFVIKPEMLETIVPVQDKSKRYTPHAKYHRLHLNIARVYSPGQVPPKPEVFPSVYPGNKGWRQPQPQVYVPHPYPDLDLNTILYPVKRHRKGYRFRTSIIHL